METHKVKLSGFWIAFGAFFGILAAAAVLLIGCPMVCMTAAVVPVVSQLGEIREEAKQRVAETDAPGADDFAVPLQTVKTGSFQVTVFDCAIGRAEYEQPPFGRTKTSDDDLLLIRFNIQNVSKDKKVDYASIAGTSRMSRSLCARLTDNRGNEYSEPFFAENLTGRVGFHSFYPGDEKNDVLAFERPVDGFDYLTLELPQVRFKSSGTLRFRITPPDVSRASR